MKSLKTIITLIFIISSLFLTSCESETNTSVYESAEEFNKKNNTFLKEYPSKIEGTWKIEKMVLVPNTMSDIFKTDTILYNVGKISIDAIDQTHPKEPRMNMILNGDFSINDEIIPFQSSRLLPFADDNFAIALMSVDSKYFPEPEMSFDQLPIEYHFLSSYFFNDNYEMTLSEDKKTWKWKGLDHSAKEIILTKID